MVWPYSEWRADGSVFSPSSPPVGLYIGVRRLPCSYACTHGLHTPKGPVHGRVKQFGE